jgi:hypothetical protein
MFISVTRRWESDILQAENLHMLRVCPLIAPSLNNPSETYPYERGRSTLCIFLTLVTWTHRMGSLQIVMCTIILRMFLTVFRFYIREVLFHFCYLQKLVLTSLTSSGRSVGIVRLRTQAKEFSFSFSYSIFSCESSVSLRITLILQCFYICYFSFFLSCLYHSTEYLPFIFMRIEIFYFLVFLHGTIPRMWKL